MRLTAALARFALAIALATPAASAALAQPRGAPDALLEIAAHDLPVQARETLNLIHRGGPFPYDRDGVRFGNRERLLPLKAHHHYREYTVRTPGARNRGARRIVCGGMPRSPDACYYTDDHYQSFKRIRE